MIAVSSYTARFRSSNNILTLFHSKGGEVDQEDTEKEPLRMRNRL